MPSPRIGVLGPTEVQLDGVTVRLRSRRQRRLLAALVLWRAGASADRLADAVWGEALPRDPAGALANQVARLRDLLGARAIESGSGGYRLSPSVVADVDLPPADAPWRGWPYEDLDLDDARAEAGRLVEQRAALVEREVERSLAEGDTAAAIARARALAVEHPLRERAHLLLAKGLAASGRRAEALACLEELRRRLDEEVGAGPSAEVAALHACLVGEGRSPVRRRRVHSPGPLVGRDELVAATLDGLRRHRLLTLAGPGGVGKTALALEVGASLGSEVIDLVSLGALPAGDEAAPAVAAQLAVEGGGAGLAARIGDVLGAETGVLILDNAEHVLPGVAALVDTILARTPVRILVTSRVRLGHPNEHVLPVAPLPTAGAAGGAAGRLFSERAAGVRDGWRGGDPDAIAAICRRLDGLPLAIELAAAQLASSTLEELVARLDHPLEVVRSPTPGRPGLREVVARSLELLDERDRQVLAQLAAFHGGCTTVDATVACEGIGDPAEVRVSLDRLVRASLLTVADRSYGTRCSMLETVRTQVVDAWVDVADHRDHHADAILQAVERGRTEAFGPEEPAWVDRLVDDRANVVAAFQHHAGAGRADRAARVAAAAYVMSIPRRHVDLSDLVIAAADLAEEAGVDPSLLVETLGLAADALAYRGSSRAALDLLERARAAGAPLAAYRYCDAVAADLALYAGAVDEAVGHLGRASAGFEASAQPALAAWMRATIPLARSYAGPADAHVGAALDALADAERTGCPSTVAFARYALAEVLCGRDPDEAVVQLRRALDEALAVEAFFVAGLVRLSLATDATRRDDLARSAPLHREAIAEWQRLGNWAQQATTLRSAALLLARAQRLDAAATILLGLRRLADHDPWGADAAAVADVLDVARTRLSEADRAAAAAAATFTRPMLVGFAADALDALAGR